MDAESTFNTGRHASRYWRATAVVALAAFGFGFAGLMDYERSLEPGADVDVGSAAYHTFQLFILHAPHLESPLPWALHVGRLLGALVFALVGGKAVWTIFRDEWLLVTLQLPWTRGHIVICGLGEIGLRVALEGRRLGKRVVAIEKNPDPARHDIARRQRVLVLEGDACDAERLKTARVGRAEFVVASCHEDHTNVAVAAMVGDIVGADRARSTPLVCRMLINNARTRRLLADHRLFLHASIQYQVNFSDLDRYAVAARQALHRHPLDFNPISPNDDTLVHLVLVGFGAAGESMALHAARIGHFANETKARRLRFTIVDAAADVALAAFKTRHPNLDLVCDTGWSNQDIDSPGLVSTLTAFCQASASPKTLVTYAFCLSGTTGDDVNFRLAVELARKIAGQTAQILVHQTTGSGFAALLPQDHRGQTEIGRLYPFGMTEDVFNWDVLLHESEDAEAKALHDDYCKRRLKDDPPQTNPEWAELDDGMRDSNRQAADHIPIKLRALGYHTEPLTKTKKQIPPFSAPEVHLLARMEHARWCAERYLAGWRHGVTTDRANKINRCLIEFDNLPVGEEKKDHEQITAIPGALSQMKLGIYRE